MDSGYDRAGWDQPSAGLRTIAGAMVAQMVAVLFTFLMLLYAVNARRPDGLQGFAMIIAVGMYAAQLAMVAGIFRFAKQPPPAPGGAAASVAAILGVIGILMSTYALFIMLKIMGIGPDSSYDDIRSVMESAESLPKIEVAAAVLGFIAMLSLLGSISAVARYLGREDLASRTTTAIVLVVIGAGIWAAVKLGAEPTTVGTAILFAMLAMGLQIAILVQVWRLAHGLSEALDAGPTTDLPKARQL